MTARLALGMACVLLAGGTSAVVLRTPGWVPGASASRRDASRGGVLVARGAKPRAVAHSWLMARRCLNDTQKLRRVAPRRRGPETRVPPKNEGGIKHTPKEAYRKTRGVQSWSTAALGATPLATARQNSHCRTPRGCATKKKKHSRTEHRRWRGHQAPRCLPRHIHTAACR